MRKILLFCCLAAALSATTACNEERDYGTPNEEYTGTLVVTPPGEAVETHTYENKRFRLVSDDDGTMTLWMVETQFVPQMPVLTMEIPGIAYTREPERLLLNGDRIVPRMGGTPYERYLITSLEGVLTDGMSEHRLTLSFECMGFHVTYDGIGN